ncbi:MAG: hypothetical protein ACJ0BI_09170 [Paracoccaceae bacterium]
MLFLAFFEYITGHGMRQNRLATKLEFLMNKRLIFSKVILEKFSKGGDNKYQALTPIIT